MKIQFLFFPHHHTEVINSSSGQDSDSGDDEDTVNSGVDSRGVKQERSERKVECFTIS